MITYLDGLDLPSDKLEILKTKKQRLSELCISFSQNIANDSTFILCTRQELDGLDDSFIDNLEQVDGKYKVTVQYPDLIPVMKLCKNPETRKRLDFANSTRCKENVELLQEAIRIRDENAKMLGYEV